ncbi:hypothetical protein Leryth_018331 [Lithospermum erythrorhizon]|nr:hypothetical protein Leryth_018331 [Lithospermum erythrorhizon]
MWGVLVIPKILIESDVATSATLTPFTDWVSVSPLAVSESSTPPTHYPHRSNFFPGDELAAVYLEFEGSVDYINFEFECDEYLRINCRVSTDCTAFLPINIFLKWWKHVKTYGEIYRPFLGIKVANLFTASIDRLETIVHDCDISDGVIVALGSSAASANMRPGDVICQCDGRPVKSMLEFFHYLCIRFILFFSFTILSPSLYPEEDKGTTKEILAKNDSISKKSTKNKAKKRKKISEGEGSISSKAKTGKRKRKRKNKT